MERQPHHLQPKCICSFESSVSVWLNLSFVIDVDEFVRITELPIPSGEKLKVSATLPNLLGGIEKVQMQGKVWKDRSPVPLDEMR